MYHKIYPPAASLHEIISHFWEARWDPHLHSLPSSYFLVASSMANFTFAFDTPDTGSQLLFSQFEGQTHRPGILPVRRYGYLFGVSVYPHAISRLIRESAGELSDTILPLPELLGAEGIMLNDQISGTRSTEERIRLLSRYFLTRMNDQAQDKPMLAAMDIARRGEGRIKVADLAAGLHLSERQFNRRFRSFSGFSPKLYNRIIRFESIITRYPGTGSLTELSHDSGYYDQAHLNHDFRNLSGFNPSEFWKLTDTYG